MTEYSLTLSLDDLCRQLELSQGVCIDLVEYGVVTPGGRHPTEWTFDSNMVYVIRRAVRLHRDLGLGWEDVAFVNDLLEERDRLRAENELLTQRLSRFLHD